MSEALNAIYFKDFKNSYIPQILEEIYINRVYDPFVAGRKDMTIMDIGCNIGLFSIFASEYAKQVLAYEPSQEIYDIAKKNLDANGISNVKLFKQAVSNRNGEEKFYHNTNRTMFSLKDTVNDKNDFEMVEMVTFDKIFEDNKIESLDLLKLDCEGFEGELVSSDGFAKVCDKIKVIVGEHHVWASMSQPMFANTLSDLGFRFKWLEGVDAQVFTAIREPLTRPISI